MVVLHFPEPTGTASTAIKWCAVGSSETLKCDTWSINSMVDHKTPAIECDERPHSWRVHEKDYGNKTVLDGNMGIRDELEICLLFNFAAFVSQLSRSVKRLTQWQWMEDRCTQRGSAVLVPALVEQYDEGMRLREHRNHPIQSCSFISSFLYE